MTDRATEPTTQALTARATAARASAMRPRHLLFGVDLGALATALAIGSAGGAILAYYNLPLAWMIGAMLANLTASVAAWRVAVPMSLRAIMVMVLGILLGSAFTPEILDQAAQWGVSLIGLTAFTIASTAVGFLYLRRTVGCDVTTAFFTAAPGGLNEMVIVGGKEGGDDRFIALAHGLRVMLVVFLIPIWFILVADYSASQRGPLGPDLADVAPLDLVILAACLIGYVPARLLKLPAPVLTGPMVVSAVVHGTGVVAGGLPGIAVAIAQVVVGSSLGCRFKGVTAMALARMAVVAFGLTLLMLAMTGVTAAATHWLTGLPPDALVLAYAPGGLAEMSLVALALDTDAAFVSTHHIIRILMIVVLWPLTFRLARGRFARERSSPEG